MCRLTTLIASTMEKKNESCCACAADFKKAVDALVTERQYTPAGHDSKAAEVKAAFGAEGVDATSGTTHAVHAGSPQAAHGEHSHATHDGRLHMTPGGYIQVGHDGRQHVSNEGHTHPGMSGTLTGTAAHHRMENMGTHYHDSHYHTDRTAISPEHHRLHHEPHHQMHHHAHNDPHKK